MSDRLFRILYITLFIIILFPSEANAQDKKISYVEQGQEAPFDGVLLSPEAFAELKISSELAAEELELKIKHRVEYTLLGKQLEIDNLNVQLVWQQKEYDGRLKLKNTQIDGLYKSLEKETKMTLWEQFKGPVHFVSGIVLSIGLFYVHSLMLAE